jgi:hypothetical protein
MAAFKATMTLPAARTVCSMHDLTVLNPTEMSGGVAPAEIDAAMSYAENEKAALTRECYSSDRVDFCRSARRVAGGGDVRRAEPHKMGVDRLSYLKQIKE